MGTTQPPSQPHQESTPVVTEQPTQRHRRVKQMAQRFPQTQQEEPTQNKQRTGDQATQNTQVSRVNPNDTTKI